jgi:hypothetical protein
MSLLLVIQDNGPRARWVAANLTAAATSKALYDVHSRVIQAINVSIGSKLHVPGVSTTRQKYTQLLPERHDAFHGEFVPQPDSCTATKIKITRS